MASPLSVEDWLGYIRLQLRVAGHVSCIAPKQDPSVSSDGFPMPPIAFRTCTPTIIVWWSI